MKLVLALCALMSFATAASAQSPSRKWAFDPAKSEAKVRGADIGILRLMCRTDAPGLKVRVSSGEQLGKGEQPFRVAFVSFDEALDDRRIWSYSASRAELTRDWAVDQFIEGASGAKVISISVVTAEGAHVHFRFGTENFEAAVAAARASCGAAAGAPSQPPR